VRFAGKFAGETLGLIPCKTSLQQLTALLDLQKVSEELELSKPAPWTVLNDQ
jgi:hypothetical protein